MVDFVSKNTVNYLMAAVSFALSTVLVATPVFAQSSPDHVAQARTLFEHGVQLIDERRFAEAITSLEESQRLRPSPAVTYNLGLALRGVGRVQDAIAAFERYLAQPSRSATPTELEQVRGIVTQLRAAIVQLDLRTIPSTSVVRLDGQAPVSLTGPVTLDPGPHTLEISAPTYLSTTRTLQLAAGSRTTLEVTLEPTPSVATLVVEPTVATATVWIDGRDVGQGTVTQTVSAGEHTIRVGCAVCETARRTVRLERGQQLRIGMDVTRRPSGVAPWVIGVGIAAGVVVAGAAIALGVFAASNGPLVGEYTGQQAGSWGMSHRLPKRTR
ncbi:MAG: PEGA domain-containing protein [Deltaproteobacteria bacterium]|nr:PEGA domain-containing protein [Deltaproteobacteria bacterium]